MIHIMQLGDFMWSRLSFRGFAKNFSVFGLAGSDYILCNTFSVIFDPFAQHLPLNNIRNMLTFPSLEGQSSSKRRFYNCLHRLFDRLAMWNSVISNLRASLKVSSIWIKPVTKSLRNIKKFWYRNCLVNF